MVFILILERLIKTRHIMFVCIVTILIMILSTTNAFAKDIDGMQAEIDLYNTQIERIHTIKTQLNALANIFRENENLSSEFINVLGNEWTKLDSMEQDLNIKIITLREEIDYELSPKYSESDLDLLARIINAEASPNLEEDMLLVGNVVLNRVNSSKFPNTIRDVIYAKGQYSPTWNGAINKTPSSKAIECAIRLLEGERFCPSNVVFQASFKQGSGLWKKVGVHYYCYQ